MKPYVNQDIMDVAIGITGSNKLPGNTAMRFTLRQLGIFLAAAKHQNISRAAQSLHMSQSAASEALIKIPAASCGELNP